MKAKHKFLGEVEITPECELLQKWHDSTSIFVEHNGEIKEVSKALIEFYKED